MRVVFLTIMLFIGQLFVLLLARVLGALQSRVIGGVRFGHRRSNFIGFRTHKWWPCVRDRRKFCWSSCSSSWHLWAAFVFLQYPASFAAKRNMKSFVHIPEDNLFFQGENGVAVLALLSLGIESS